MKNFMKLAAATAFLGAAAAVPAQAGVNVGIVLTPPPPRYEVRPVNPYGNGVWIDGHWGRHEGAWAWVPGRWDRPSGTYTRWVRGHYNRYGMWVRGHWR